MTICNDKYKNYTNLIGRELRDENNDYHCDDGPAYVGKTYIIYYNHGLKHRIGGPAFIWKDGDWAYYFEDMEHRDNGPSSRINGRYNYNIMDKEITEQVEEQISKGVFPSDPNNWTEEDKFLFQLMFG